MSVINLVSSSSSSSSSRNRSPTPVSSRGGPVLRRKNDRLTNKSNFGNQGFELVKAVLDGVRSQFPLYLTKSHRKYTLVNANGKTLLGFATVKKGPDSLQLSLIGAVPGKGYGQTLMKAIQQNAKAEGLRGVNIANAVTGAMGFYKKQGYRVTKRARTIRMTRNVSRSPMKKRKPLFTNNDNYFK